MVCRRCLLAVEDVLIRSAIPFNKVVTGEIHLSEKLGILTEVILPECENV